MSQQDRLFSAPLWALIVLQAVMLAALFARVPPHPPEVTPLFAIAPFVAASIAAAAAALTLGANGDRWGSLVGLLAGAMAMVSYGPQKYLDPQFPLIWPSVLAGQVAVLAIVAGIVVRRRDTARR